MERVCRRFRRVALSLPCRVWLDSHLVTKETADSMLRCFCDRVPGRLSLSVNYSEEYSLPVQGLVAAFLPTVTR